MSWDEDWSWYAGTEQAPGADAYTTGAILASGAAAGASIGSVTRALRSAGLGFQSSQISAVYKGIAAQVAANATASALSVDASTGEIMGGTPPANWTGQYVHQVTATFRTRDDQGNYGLSQRTLGIKSASVLTPFEAAQDALGIISAPDEGNGGSSFVDSGDLLGLTLTGAWYDTNPTLLRGL